MTEARQTIAVIMTFKESHKKEPERRSGANQSSRKKHPIEISTQDCSTSSSSSSSSSSNSTSSSSSSSSSSSTTTTDCSLLWTK
jgi:hypothetical protein